MEGELVFNNGSYEVWQREYMPGYFVYDLRSCWTGKVYLSYSMDRKEAEAHASWYAYN